MEFVATASALELFAAAGAGASILNAAGAFGADAPAQVGAPPGLPTPTPMPTPDDDAAKAAKRRQMTALSQRRGRQSTILSEPASSDLLGA